MSSHLSAEGSQFPTVMNHWCISAVEICGYAHINLVSVQDNTSENCGMGVMKSLRELSPKLSFVGKRECSMCVTFSSSMNYGYLSMIHAISCMSTTLWPPYPRPWPVSCRLKLNTVVLPEVETSEFWVWAFVPQSGLAVFPPTETGIPSTIQYFHFQRWLSLSAVWAVLF